MQSLIGKQVSHFNILSELGAGGMGVVYKAHDTRLKRTVALKFLPANLSSDLEAKQRFIHEAQAASALDHPNICTIHEIGETDDGQSYIAMACYEGISLKERISGVRAKHSKQNITQKAESGARNASPRQTTQPLSIDESINITIQIGKGLQKAHTAGIIHRDIKPANIMISADGTIKILDFGLAKLAGQTRLTKTGSTVGTVAYMSPEQATGDAVDQRTDIWSLGVVLYEMLTGQLPFKGEYEQALIYTILNEEPLPVTVLNEDVPAELEQIVHKCLAKDPQERYQTIDDLLVDFKGFSKELDISFDESLPRLLSRVWRKKIIKKLTFGATLIIMLAVGYFIIWARVTEPISIAVIGFENQTGDASNNIYSKSIPNLLSTALIESEQFQILPWERMNDLKKQIGKDSVEFIDSELGFQLAKMADFKSIAIGSFAKMGDIFAIDVKIFDVKTKDILQTAQSRGNGISSILSQIDDLTKQLTTSLGHISEAEYAQIQRPVMNVTTSNIQAYNFYIRGMEELDKLHYKDSEKYFLKAIELDSTFAMAHLELGNYKKAKKYAEKATRLEQLKINVAYAAFIEKDWSKGVQIREKIAEQFPTDKDNLFMLGHDYRIDGLYERAEGIFSKALKLDPEYGPVINELAYLYSEIGNYKKSMEYLQLYASVSPGDANPFDTMALVYLRFGKLDEALDMYKEALDVKPDFPSAIPMAYVYALKENYDQTCQLINRWASNNDAPFVGPWLNGFIYYWLGNTTKSLVELEKCKQFTSMTAITVTNWLKIWIYMMRGDYSKGREQFKQYVDLIKAKGDPFFKIGPAFFSGYMNLLQSQIDSASYNLVQMHTLISKLDLKSQKYWKYCHNLLYANILLARDSLNKAIEVYEAAEPKYINWLFPWTFMYHSTTSVLKFRLVDAYLNLGNLDKALTFCQSLINPDSLIKFESLIYPPVHYRLAKLYEETGLHAESIKEYERFINLWQRADINTKDLADAKKRLAGLINKK